MPLEKFFNPQSIAIIGATEDPQNITSVIVKNLEEMGYRGRIVPVNPHHDTVFGFPCYPSLLTVKEQIDLTVIAIPSHRVPEVLQQHSKCGIKNSIIISGGFGEIGGKGALLEKEIKRICRQDGISVIGPNCIGVFDNYSNFTTSFLPWNKVQKPGKGYVSILTQSGSYAVSLMDLLAQENIGVSKIVSYGNRVDIGESALIEYFINDESTRVIGIYMESVDEGRRFINASRRCSKTKHMVALKVGRGNFGIDAIRSHTGAIAGKFEIYRAAFRESGILEVDGLEDFIDACKVLSMQKPARGNKILVITNGGGFGVAVSDMCSNTGLDLSRTPRSIKENLEKEFPEFYILNNPVDITGSSGNEDFGTVMKTAFIDDDFFDAAIVIPLMPPPGMTEGIVDIISQKAREAKKPVIICTIGGMHTRKIKLLFEEHNIPVFPSPERCVKAMSILVERGRICMESGHIPGRMPENFISKPEEKTVSSVSKTPRDLQHKASLSICSDNFKEAANFLKNIPSKAKTIVLPDKALDIIKSIGITTPAYLLTKTPEETVEAAELLGFPVVLKVSSPEILHKSDVGGVAVNVKNREDAKRHYHAIMSNISRNMPDTGLNGILVEKQLPGATEVIVGGIRDEQFGPTVMFGLGGIFVEIFADVSFRIAPVTEAEALKMIQDIKGYPILSGYRGARVMDVQQLIKSIVTVSEFISHVDRIKEIELNPLFVYEKGVVAVDARIILE
ncbi:MAG: acetate--CoA ligase family protein [Candidatus Scalindua sp.]|nr:acetate--CoA ligase family protein [Candidatus Scalindua sp.]